MNWNTLNILGLSEIERGWFRDMTKFSIIIQIVLWLVVTSICSQTVHRSDLDYFVGQLRINNTDSGRFIDCCDFEDWFVEVPVPYENSGTKSRPRLHSIPRSRDYTTYANLKAQRIENTEFKFYGSYGGEIKEYWWSRWMVFHENRGYGNQNILTFWLRDGRDSLRFVCGQIGPFDGVRARVEVRRVTAFPDSSFLVVVEHRGSEYGRFDFFRALVPCELELFYSKLFTPMPGNDIARGNSSSVSYNLEKLVHPNYQISEITEFGRFTTTHLYTEKYHLDSTKVQILDLWEMAIEHFNIDTTSSN